MHIRFLGTFISDKTFGFDATHPLLKFLTDEWLGAYTCDLVPGLLTEKPWVLVGEENF